jgi:hypothetical protein
MINFKTIIRIIGILLLLETVMFLVCSGVSFYYRESDMLDFWKAGGITAGVAYCWQLSAREANGN